MNPYSKRSLQTGICIFHPFKISNRVESTEWGLVSIVNRDSRLRVGKVCCGAEKPRND